MGITFDIQIAEDIDHFEIMKVARRSKYTLDFGNRVRYSGVAHYRKGYIRKAIVSGRIVGFTCFNPKKRVPEIMLYFIGVNVEHKRVGIASALLKDLVSRQNQLSYGPHPIIVVSVDNQNAEGLAFYKKHGFKKKGEAFGGHGTRFKKLYTNESSISCFLE